MCRVLGYLGEPASLEGMLYDADSALVRQSYSPQMMDRWMNLAGFGMAAWDERSVRSHEPFTYQIATMPSFDRNLRGICRKLEPSCVLAHVRGISWSPDNIISEQNLHPFRFPGAKVVMAHNGHLRDFDRMRYDLLDHLRPGLSQHIAGTTDSEWIYALLLSQLEDPEAEPDAAELVEATTRVLRIVRDVRAGRDLRLNSPINLFMATRRCIVAARYVLDYGWYPDDDWMMEADLPYTSLWYTTGRAYAEHDGEWQMLAADGPPRSLIISSEPLTLDTATWLEVPEYSMLSASLGEDGLAVQTIDVDV